MLPTVQKPAPDFSCSAVVNGAIDSVKLADFRGKYLVLFFYPLDFTFVCPTEILAFGDRAAEFEAVGAKLVGASVDSVFSHLAWLNTPRKEGGIAGVTIPLIGDVNRKLSQSYGVLADEGLDEGSAFRALFIIDPDGKLRHITMNDMPIGRSVDEALRVVQALQFHAEHGEVCPANWKPGDDGMTESSSGKKGYFAKHG
mgnify:CR=1 FL=1